MSALNAMFGFRGRLARLPAFGYSMLSFLILFFLGFVLILSIRHLPPGPGRSELAIGVFVLLFLIGSWFSLTISWKRFHDLDVTGAYAIPLVALNLARLPLHPRQHPYIILGVLAVEIIAGLILLFAPGSKGPNRFEA